MPDAKPAPETSTPGSPASSDSDAPAQAAIAPPPDPQLYSIAAQETALLKAQKTKIRLLERTRTVLHDLTQQLTLTGQAGSGNGAWAQVMLRDYDSRVTVETEHYRILELVVEAEMGVRLVMQGRAALQAVELQEERRERGKQAEEWAREREMWEREKKELLDKHEVVEVKMGEGEVEGEENARQEAEDGRGVARD